MEPSAYQPLDRVEGPSTIADASTNLLMAFNVLAYFEDDEANAGLVASLLTRPSEPARVTLDVRGNPLPPLRMDPAVFADIDARDCADTLDGAPEDRWKLLFQCSMFGSRSIRR